VSGENRVSFRLIPDSSITARWHAHGKDKLLSSIQTTWDFYFTSATARWHAKKYYPHLGKISYYLAFKSSSHVIVKLLYFTVPEEN